MRHFGHSIESPSGTTSLPVVRKPHEQEYLAWLLIFFVLFPVRMNDGASALRFIARAIVAQPIGRASAARELVYVSLARRTERHYTNPCSRNLRSIFSSRASAIAFCFSRCNSQSGLYPKRALWSFAIFMASVPTRQFPRAREARRNRLLLLLQRAYGRPTLFRRTWHFAR